MKNIEYEEIKLLKQSEKSTVLLVRETDGEKLFVQKILKGQHHIYSELLNWHHPYLPKLHDVEISDKATTIIEEYIEGQSLGNAELSEKQVCNAIKELCSVLEFLHGKGVIHRDIKPSNIIITKDGHIRLIDFDAARMVRDNLEQDTRLLGTRGYAPPEQYGFAQTDARTDVYSLGVTLGQVLGEKSKKYRYKRFIDKCTDLNPSKRYQSVKQAKKALDFPHNSIGQIISALAIVCILCLVIYNPPKMEDENILSDKAQLQTQTGIPSTTLQPPNTEDEELKLQTGGENNTDSTDLTDSTEVIQEPLSTPEPSQQIPIPEQTEPTPEQSQLPITDEDESKAPPKGDERIVLTDIIKPPFSTIDSVPVDQIGAEWEIDDPPVNADATLYKDDQAIAKVRLFEDGGSDVQSRKIQLWSTPAIASEYIKVSEYLELDMSKDEVLAALEEAKQYPILPYPGMVLGKGDDGRISLLYEGYNINYYFRPDMTIVEIEVYLPNSR